MGFILNLNLKLVLNLKLMIKS